MSLFTLWIQVALLHKTRADRSSSDGIYHSHCDRNAEGGVPFEHGDTNLQLGDLAVEVAGRE